MLSFVSWQDDSSAESDDEEEEVSLRLQAQFVTFIDSIVLFSVFQVIFYKRSGVLFIKFKTQCSAEFFLRVSDNQLVGHF